MTAFLLIGLAGVVAVASILMPDWLAARRHRRWLAAGLAGDDVAWLVATLPLYARVPGDLRARLDGLTRAFIEEKEFIGCDGLQVSHGMRLTIAAQASLLVLGWRGPVGPYDQLRSVLVYPSQFIVPESWHDEHGVVTEEQRVLAGQAFDAGRIVLSWEDVLGRDGGPDAYNVVIHEFAHYLDAEEGAMNGAPWLATAQARERWARVLGTEFAALRERADRGEETLIDAYGAEDEAEFFAVATETFFEASRELADLHPALYAELAGFYGIDPARW